MHTAVVRQSDIPEIGSSSEGAENLHDASDTSLPQWSLTDRSLDAGTPEESKVKVKTKGVPAPQPVELEPQEELPETPEAQSIVVPRRAYDTFEQIFAQIRRAR